MYKILIVEDEKIIRKNLVYGYDYESLGCVVAGEARDGQEGASFIKENEPDVVITDINMPIMDAFDMLEETIDYSYSTIIISGYDEFDNAKKAIKYGVTEFIVKPIENTEYEEAIHRAIEQVRINRERQESTYRRRAIRNTNLLDFSVETDIDEVVQEMLVYIKDHYQKKFVFSEVAKNIGYSQTLLYKKFKEGTGMTFNEYLNKYRIQQSIEQLKDNKLKIQDIAFENGFSEYKYFNKVFRKYIGMSPTEFKEKV